VARRCVFCQREGKLTLEHVLPRWIERQLPDADRVTDVTHTQKREGKEIRKWTADSLDMKVRRVCADCNGGWMSALERTAALTLRPLIAGSPRRLLPAEQEIIAVWAIKTALMCEFIHPDSRGGADEHFRWLGEHLKPTPNGHVWLAAYTGSKDMDYEHRDLRMEPEDGPVSYRKGYISAFVINRLVLYVMDVEGEPRVRTRLTAHAERAALQITPFKHALATWPPQVRIDDRLFVEFLEMIAPESYGEEPT
jgi:hypothetical protein